MNILQAYLALAEKPRNARLSTLDLASILAMVAAEGVMQRVDAERFAEHSMDEAACALMIADGYITHVARIEGTFLEPESVLAWCAGWDMARRFGNVPATDEFERTCDAFLACVAEHNAHKGGGHHLYEVLAPRMLSEREEREELQMRATVGDA